MRKVLAGTALMVCAAVPSAQAKQFVAADAAHAGLKRGGRIVISNDATSIRAQQYGRNVHKTLVQLRSAKRVTPSKKTILGTRVPASLAGHIQDAASHYRIDPRLLAAVARRESRFRPNAVSPVGARGVMQLMPATAAWLGVTNSFDARQNIFGGAKYLKMLLDSYRGDVSLTLAAYNAGPGAVRKHRGIPPYAETTKYVAEIRRDYESSR